jgi:hypothetical protein
MTLAIAVIGPMGFDECAHYFGDGLVAVGADVRMIDPLRVRELVRTHFGQQGINDHYVFRKPLSLQWLVNNAVENCDIRGCSILFITDQPIEYINDLEPFDELGNTPIVVFHHNEYNQPPSVIQGANIVAYGQPQLRQLYQALYPWGASRVTRHFDLPAAVFPERIQPVRMVDKPFADVCWPTDNFHGRASNPARITRWHSLSNDLWRSVDDVLMAAFQHGVKGIDLEGDIEFTRQAYLEHTKKHRAALIAFPLHIYAGRRLFETICCGTLPVIHVQVERFGWEDPLDYNWRLDKFYSHERFLAQCGFQNGVNCLMYRNPEELDYICKYIADDSNLSAIQRMADAALELVKQRHTYVCRAKQLLTEVQLYRDIVRSNAVEDETGISLPYTRHEVQL